MTTVRVRTFTRLAQQLPFGTFLLTLFGATWMVCLFGPLFVLSLWAVARTWFWPSPLPTVYTLDWFRYAWAVPGVLSSLRTSVIVAVSVVVSTTLIALAAGYALGRLDVPGKSVVRMLFVLPLMVPYIAIGLGVSMALYQLNLVGTLPGIILAHSIATLPFGILILSSAFESLDRSIEEAAAACGAAPFKRFTTVTLPIITPAILAQAVYVFTISMDEFTLSLLVTSPATATLPIRIYTAITEGYIQISAALSVLLLVPNLVLVFLMVRYLKPEYLTMGGV